MAKIGHEPTPVPEQTLTLVPLLAHLCALRLFNFQVVAYSTHRVSVLVAATLLSGFLHLQLYLQANNIRYEYIHIDGVQYLVFRVYKKELEDGS